MLGVLTSGWPATPRHSPRHWSAVMKRMFSSVSEREDVARGDRHAVGRAQPDEIGAEVLLRGAQQRVHGFELRVGKQRVSGHLWRQALHRLGVDGGGGITGSADLPTGNLNAAVNGGGHIDMRAVHADAVHAAVNGGGHIQVYAGSTLKAAVSGGGLIQYWGNPQVTSAISGGGDVRQGS